MGKERSLTPDEYLKTLIVVAATMAGDTRLRVSNIPSKIFFLRDSIYVMRLDVGSDIR